jgi:type II secretory pathway component PulK
MGPLFFASPFSAPLRRGRRAAVALVMVLCALFLLSMIILGLAHRLDQQTFLMGNDGQALEARALAFSGLEIALHPLSSARTPALHRQVDRTHSFNARITGEGGKLNLNWLLAGDDPRKISLLKNYFDRRGLNFQEREILADCMLDWITPGDTTHLNGSRVGLDGLPVPGRPFEDLSEIKRIVGSEPLTRLQGWDRDFTLLSKGPIDLQWADEDVVGSLPGVGSMQAHGFVRARRGEDGLDGTADDLIFANANSALLVPGMLGLSPTAFQAIQDLITFSDTTVRIVSVGQSGKVSRTFEVVARKDGMPPEILQWNEM